MKLISWNVAGRRGRLEDQIRAVLRQEADLVCLQEVRESTAPRWREVLGRDGLEQVADSSGRSDRKLFNLTASRWPVTELEVSGMPQPERLLSVCVWSDSGPVEVHNVHVPPLNQGTAKLETLAAIHAALAVPSSAHRILCGDLNTARVEAGEERDDRVGRWVEAEALVLRDLAQWDLRDVFLQLQAHRRNETSCSTAGHWRKRGHRLDHIFASRGLGAVFCDYQHGWRQEGFSDHSAMEAIFDPDSLGA